MVDVTLGNGISISTSGYAVDAGGPIARRRGAASAVRAGGTLDALDALLQAADFRIDADFILKPAVAPAGRRRAVDAPKADLSVTVAPGEAAVLLVEDDAGLLGWHTPDNREAAAIRTRRATGTSLNFILAPTRSGRAGAARRRGPIGEWIAEKIVEPVRVRVLRYLVSKTIDAAVNRIEGDNPTGPVLLAAGLPVAQWTPGPLRPDLPDTGRPLRILLLVHGTFSSTAGSFGGLAGTKLFDAMCTHYDLVLGHDHRTLGDHPRANAEAMLASLHSLDLPPESVVDAVAYSRGGLVYRILAEELLPASGLALRLGKVVFVGCTNAGTQLAEPENWEELVNLYTNILVAAAKIGAPLLGAAVAAPWIAYGITTIGRFVQLLPQIAISERRLPGLAAMEPDGETVVALNGTPPAPGFSAEYYAVTSRFEPGGATAGLGAKAAMFLADRAIDRLFGEQNDLVVHTASMTDFGRERVASGVHALGEDGHVYHTIYFATPAAMAPIAGWLALDLDRDDAEPDAEPPSWEREEASDRWGEASIDGGEGAIDEGVADKGFELESFEPRKRGIDRGAAAIDRSEPVAAPPLDDAQQPHAVVERYIAAEMEPTPRLERPASVFVTVSPHPIAVADHDAAATTAEPALARADRMIAISVIPRSNCAVEGRDRCEVDPISTEDEISRFRIRGLTAGPAELLVEVRQGVATLASFLLQPEFVDEQAPLRVVQTLPPPADRDAGRAVLRIYEFRGAEGTTLRYDLASEDGDIALLETVRLPRDFDMGVYAVETLKTVEDAWNLRMGDGKELIYKGFLRKISGDAKERTRQLVPESIRQALWDNRAKIKSIQVISEEPHIPWELMYLFDPKGAETDHQGFFAEFGLIRWLHNAPLRARPPLDGAKSHYVVPAYLNADHTLPGAAEEEAMLKYRLKGISPITANSLDVLDFLAAGNDCAVLHFACHGQTGQKGSVESSLLMTGLKRGAELFDDPLTWQSVKAEANFGPGAGPLVFVNACQTGRVGAGITGVAGFADAFIRPHSRRGASAFIGALWSVDDQLATSFADTLYTALGAKKTLIEAVHAAREACKANHDFTWLSYSIYSAA